MDRIKLLHLTKDDFVIPEDFNLEDFMRPSFGVFQGEPIIVKIWFHPDDAGYIKEKIWHESQEIHNQDDGSIIFEAEVAGTGEIKFWILNWGAKAEVFEPESLREEIRAEARAILERYKESIAEEEPLTHVWLILTKFSNYKTHFSEM